jgi:hypothetical protein
MGEYTLFTAILGLVLGTLFFYYDSKSGRKLYKRWHDISSKDKLDENLNVGFVNGQLFGQKLSVAISFTAIFYVIGFFILGMNLIHGLFYSLGLFLGLMLAFYIAPKFLAIFSKKAGKTIEYIESIEKGDKKLTDELNKILPKKEAIVTEPSETKETPKEKEIETPKETPKKDDDWRKGIKGFLDK